MAFGYFLVLTLSLSLHNNVEAQDCNNPDVCKECPKFKCTAGATLVPGAFCGCCPGCSKPDPQEEECSPDFCDTVRCAPPECSDGEILTKGTSYCSCCGDCITPKKGDKCYTDLITWKTSCGNKLSCSHGICG